MPIKEIILHLFTIQNLKMQTTLEFKFDVHLQFWLYFTNRTFNVSTPILNCVCVHPVPLDALYLYNHFFFFSCAL